MYSECHNPPIEMPHCDMEPTIEMGVDGVIILCGTNNLRDESPEVVAKKIFKFGNACKQQGRTSCSVKYCAQNRFDRTRSEMEKSKCSS